MNDQSTMQQSLQVRSSTLLFILLEVDRQTCEIICMVLLPTDFDLMFGFVI